MIYQETPHGTNRLWLKRTEFPPVGAQLAVMMVSLDFFSIWGGADKNEEEQMSWEFDKGISKEVITQALQRSGCTLKEE